MRNQINLTVLAAALSTNVFAGTFSDNFSTGINPAYWSVTQTTPNLYSVNATGGSVALAKIGANPGGIQNVAVNLNLAALGGSISGDFTAQISFTNAVIGPNVDQVEFHTYFANSSIFFDVYDTSSGRNVHVWNGSYNNPMAETATAGTFTISRTGSTLTGYFNGTPIFSESESSALVGLSLILQNQPGSDDYPSVNFGDFSITGNITLLAPTLNIQKISTNQVALFWPTSASIYNLVSTTNLLAPEPWPAVTNQPTTIGNWIYVTNSVNTSQQFYRLRYP